MIQEKKKLYLSSRSGLRFDSRWQDRTTPACVLKEKG